MVRRNRSARSGLAILSAKHTSLRGLISSRI